MKDGIPDLAKALVAAQAKMRNPQFDSKNPHFKSRFASLAAVRNAVIPCFNEHGIFLTQAIYRTADGGVACATFLVHESGQWISYPPLEMPLDKVSAQGVGAASTYAKRYAMQAVAGVAGDEDDDAEAVSPDTGDDGAPAQNDGSQDAATALADRFVAAAQAGIEGAVLEVHEEANVDQGLYRRAWSLIPSKDRAYIKKVIDKAKTVAA